MPRFVGVVFGGLLLLGCSESSGPDSLTYEASTRIVSTSPMKVSTVVTVRNTGTKTVPIDRNICPSWFVAYSTASREGTPLWTNPSPVNFECASWAGPLDLAPRDYWQFEIESLVPTTAPEGLQFLTLHFSLWGDVALPVGQVVVNQGKVSLP
jgi:hypothetical protein